MDIFPRSHYLRQQLRLFTEDFSQEPRSFKRALCLLRLLDLGRLPAASTKRKQAIHHQTIVHLLFRSGCLHQSGTLLPKSLAGFLTMISRRAYCV
jgi:hypothetical protein